MVEHNPSPAAVSPERSRDAATSDRVRLPRARRASWPLLLPLCAWALLYPVLVFAAHFGLRTNAFDLSVFDYALWSTLHGAFTAVPFLPHTLFAHHWMPTLLALLPIYAAHQAPTTLIAIQLLAFAAAAVLLYRVAAARLPAPAVAALVFAFLFSRQSHSAVTSVFYIECLEPLLVFALFAWKESGALLFYALVIAALGCKEDMALYLAAFGLVCAVTTGSRRRGAITAGLSLVWLLGAVLLIVPAFRRAQGLGAAYPFLAAGATGGGGAILQAAGAFVVPANLLRLFDLTASVALLCWVAPRWLIVALVGVVIALGGPQVVVHASLFGHYLWPILPWLYLAAVAGFERVYARAPRLAPIAVAALLLVTLANSPLWQTLARGPFRDLPAASEVRRQLGRVPADLPIAAQPNLIPHLAHRVNVRALGMPGPPGGSPKEARAMTETGDLWPLDRAGVRREIQAATGSPSLRAVTAGPLWFFVPVVDGERDGRMP